MISLGAVNVLKPTGWTSSDVVVKVRHILREYTGDRHIKVGHLGTLDPAGSGVLPIVFGKATRLFDYYVDGDKIYRARFVFGKTTDTLDSYGAVTDTCDVIPTREQIEEIFPDFLGEIDQIPPQYSRISVDGKRACDVARAGGEVDIKARKVKIYSIDMLDYTSGILTLDIHCSGGTYIRSLCRDIAERLDTLAYMSMIIRLENKRFKIEDSVTLDQLSDDISKYIITLDELLSEEKSIDIEGEEIAKILNGVSLPECGIVGDYVVKIDGKIFGICRDSDGVIKVLIRLWQ